MYLSCLQICKALIKYTALQIILGIWKELPVDLQEDLHKTLRLWGLSLEQLHQRTRAIWAAGYRPGAEAAPQAVGSGFDTSDQDSP